MNKSDAQGDIRLIKDMIDRTREIAAGSWVFFLIWGTAIILAVSGMYVLIGLGKPEWIWINWTVFMLAGVLVSVVYARNFERSTGAKTYSQVAIGHLVIACGAGFFLAGFIFPMLDLYAWGLIPILIALITGIYTFTLGGILEWSFLKGCGILWWFGGLGMAFVHEHYRALLFIPLILIGYITPAMLLRRMVRKQREQNAA